MPRSFPSSRAQRIRADVASLTAGPQRRYPAALRRRIAAYARARLAQGASRGQVGVELGVSDPTLVRLLGEQRPTPRLRPVRVVSTREPAMGGSSVLVRAPGGVVIEGLDPAGIAALLRALS